MDLKNINAEKIKELVQDKKVRAGIAVGSLVLMVLIWAVVWLSFGSSNNQDKNPSGSQAVTVLPEKLNFEIEKPNKFVENMALFKSRDIFEPFGGSESSSSDNATGSYDTTAGYSTGDDGLWDGKTSSTSGNGTGSNSSNTNSSNNTNNNSNTTSSNDPPSIESTAVANAKVGDVYSYDVNADDPDGDSVSYTLTNYPTGMTINSKTGLISWTPSSSQKGDNEVTVKASDDNGGFDERSFSITVSENNETTIYLSSIFASGGEDHVRISVNGGSYQTYEEGDTVAQYFSLQDIDSASQSIVFLYGDERIELDVGKTLTKEIVN